MNSPSQQSSFEKDATKTKDATPKGKNRSGSMLMISSVRYCPSEKMKELKQCCSHRRILRFEDAHLDHPDEFYELHFSQMFVEIFNLVEKTFRPTDEWTPPRRLSPWLREYPESFNKYIELLAHPDPFSGKWDRLLRDDQERSFLIQAMVMKVIDTQVLSSLLFGASPEHAKTLQSDDVSYVTEEGFRRSNYRAHTNSMYLDARHGVPPLFWKEVDRLTTRIVAMLLPAYTLAAESPYWEPPAVQQLYQWLHDVVAYAGWLNVCIRLSPSIVVTEWIKPGQRFQLNGQENLSQELFEHSVRTALNFAKRNPKLKSDAFHDGWIARVNISVTPQITRYTPSLDESSEQGMTTYTVMKPHVVYYQGRFSDSEEKRLFMSRSEYVRRIQSRNSTPYGVALIVMFVLLALLWNLYGRDRSIGEFWSPLKSASVPNEMKGFLETWGSFLRL